MNGKARIPLHNHPDMHGLLQVRKTKCLSYHVILNKLYNVIKFLNHLFCLITLIRRHLSF